MLTKAIKYARGTVWWCKDRSSTLDEPSSVQKGKRPALIISNNDRGSAPIVEVLKLSTADKTSCPRINIPLLYNGKTTYVMCNQHFTVSLDDLENFMFVMPDDVMHRVENAMLYAQGMEHLVKLQENYASLKSLVEQIADERLRQFQVVPEKDAEAQEIIAQVISGLNKTLHDAEKAFKASYVDEDPKSDTLSQSVIKSGPIYPPQWTEKETERQDAIKDDTHTATPSKKNPRGFWTVDKMQEFCKDKESKPLSEVREKWSMKNNQIVCSMYCRLKRKLEVMIGEETVSK